MVGERELARELTLLEAVTLGIGGIIGGGLYSVTGIVAGIAGPAVILSFILCAVTALVVGYNYAKLGTKFPSSGASFEFVARAFPKTDLVRAVIGYSLWLGYIVACSFYSVSFGLYAHSFLPSVPAKAFSLVLIVIFLCLNMAGVKKTGRVENIIVLTQVTILTLFVLSSAPSIDPENFDPFFPNGYMSIFIAGSIIFIGFEGFEIICTAGEELKNPEKNLGRAIYLAITIISLLYTSVVVVSVGVVPYNVLGASTTPLADVAGAALGRYGRIALGLGALLATSSAFNAALFGSSRLAYAMSREGMMPRRFSSLSKKTRAPIYSIVAAGVLITGMTILGVVKELSALASLIFLLVFFTVSLSNLLLRKVTGSSIIGPLAAMLLCLYFLSLVESIVWISFALLILGAMSAYFLVKRK